MILEVIVEASCVVELLPLALNNISIGTEKSQFLVVERAREIERFRECGKVWIIVLFCVSWK
jgi:hypothetical protein